MGLTVTPSEGEKTIIVCRESEDKNRPNRTQGRLSILK